MAVLAGYKPENVMKYFEEICSIPHPSYKEQKISDYLVEFAKAHNLEYRQDELFNVIMIKEASKGYEDAAPIIIQGHMDMVAEQDADCKKNMDEEGLDLFVDGDYIGAKGTTLGGDDGIAVAFALAILDDDSLKHPRIEFVCTVSEEVGMEGAAGIDVSDLQGKLLLNLDSEEEGHFLAGCAGGSRLDIDLPVKTEQVSGSKIVIDVAGCTGGHSGVEIHRGRANANHILNRILTTAISKTGIFIQEYAGGSKDNAITRECSAVIVCTNAGKIMEAIQTEAEAIKNEYAVTDPEMTITIVNKGSTTATGVNVNDSAKMVALVNSLPNGVQAMSHDIEGLTETSLNLGVLKLTDKNFRVTFSCRSSVGSAHDALVTKCENIASAFGATYSEHGKYPAWEYKRESKFRDELIAIYKEMFDSEPIVETMHAGVECGLLSAKIPGLECISIGPEMHDIHTPKERLSISSSERLYNYVVKVLEHKF